MTVEISELGRRDFIYYGIVRIINWNETKTIPQKYRQRIDDRRSSSRLL